MKTEYEMVVIGGGPAGCSAAITAHSLGVSVCIVEKRSIGGQVRDIATISNLLGGSYSGLGLADQIIMQIDGCRIPVIRDEAVMVKVRDHLWTVRCRGGVVLRSHVIVAATGSRELCLHEHPLIHQVDEGYVDKFIYTVEATTLTQKEVLIIGCDRVLMTLIFSQGESLKKARVRVLALPDKWYVIEPFKEQIPFDVIRVRGISAVRKSRPQDYVVDYVGEDGVSSSSHSNVVLTNLGKRPNSELFGGEVSCNNDGYLTVERFPSAMAIRGFYAAGDVGHKAFQRISTAIGDGAYAALDYVYQRDKLYPNRT